MLIFATILLVLIPGAIVLYPFFRGKRTDDFVEDESSAQAELSRRWTSALSGIKSAELEWAIGNLSQEDYNWLRKQYMTEAAQVMKAMELEEQQEQELLDTIKLEVERVRAKALGTPPNGQHAKQKQGTSENRN
ncbi:MAG: hypothetical protein O2854_10080 [Chloroflexi bacterium]|nr:hypothetical protein [Chloroflexota bacterium]